MLGYSHNDGGRLSAGYRGKTGDCVTRATAIVAGLPYDDVYKLMAEANSNSKAAVKRGKAKRSARDGVYKDAYEVIFAKLGLEKVKLPKGVRPTYAEAHEQYGNCIVTTARHMAALVSGSLQDTFDGRTYKMLVPFCVDCDRAGYSPARPCDGSGSSSSNQYTCNHCKEKVSIAVFYEMEYDRKAQSVYIPTQ